jgi:PAS domain S-box-containing protein
MSSTLGPSAETLKALETAPNMYLVLSPELYILTASDLYLKAIKTNREMIIGKHIFEAFPDNPDLAEADGVQNINASLQAVLRTKKQDQMRLQRYDVPDQDHPGQFIRRYWDPSHTPVLDDHGNIIYIIQLATDVTEKIMAERALLKNQLLETTEQIKGLNAELLGRNVELHETQQQLNLLNEQLEEKVIRRTEQLDKANHEQAAVNEEMVATNEELIEIQRHLEETNRELARGASRLRMAVESTGLGTWELIPANGELYWSNECREIFGVAYGQPANFDDYIRHIHPDDKEWVTKRIESTLQPGSVGKYELSHRIIRADNHEVRWVNAQGTVDFDQEIATRFMGTILDITELKQVEEKSARLAAIVASSDDAIISKTLDSIITSWNDAALRIFGYSSEEMIGESIYKLIPADRLDEEPMILSRLKSGERVEHFETKRQTKDGRLIDVSLTISPLKDTQGNIIGLSKIARDISERKQDETRKNDFIGMVSHELKTPLTSLTAILQVLNSKLKKSEDPFLPGALERANHQVKKMSSMINGFLNISRLESGKLLIDKQPFIIGDLVSEVIGEVNLTGPTHIIEIQKCDKVVVMADRDKISSVLANLLSNAVKYSPRASNITVNCLRLDHEVHISITDQGLGIRQEDCAHIFDRYYRVESNRTRHISGFGIGLYLSAEIVKRHDGRIWVDSQSGQGSTFNFTLPVDQGKA